MRGGSSVAPPPSRGRWVGRDPEGVRRRDNRSTTASRSTRMSTCREPDRAIPLRVEPERPIAVLDHSVAMELAVDLHDQLCLWAGDVHDERVNVYPNPPSGSRPTLLPRGGGRGH